MSTHIWLVRVHSAIRCFQAIFLASDINMHMHGATSGFEYSSIHRLHRWKPWSCLHTIPVVPPLSCVSKIRVSCVFTIFVLDMILIYLTLLFLHQRIQLKKKTAWYWFELIALVQLECYSVFNTVLVAVLVLQFVCNKINIPAPIVNVRHNVISEILIIAQWAGHLHSIVLSQLTNQLNREYGVRSTPTSSKQIFCIM